ncbi:hypothetical protein EYR38_009793 [Pleurotus pulmonarius]|nr:hypothetical protein EYR38_009793 [Pleurotus pulmonarius]
MNPSSQSSKRQRSPDSGSQSGSSKRKRGPMPEKPKKRKDQYHLRREEVPKDTAKLQEAMNIHCHTLMGTIGAQSIPRPPSAEEMKVFETRFSDAEKINQILQEEHTSPESIRRAEATIREIRKKLATEPRTSRTSWVPDFYGTPTSLYNGALETITLWTFEQAAVSFAYAHLGIHMNHLGNTQLLKNFYQSFIWSRMKDLVIREAKKPGSVMESIEMNKVYKRRLELAERCTEHLRDDGYNPRIQCLTADAECNSDDEVNPNGPGFQYFPKLARSTVVDEFLHSVIDKSRDFNSGLQCQQRLKQEPRTPHPDLTAVSKISRRLPQNCPGYFNQLSVQDIKKGDFTWKSLSEAEFMQKYGNKVKVLYQLPTDEEINEMNSARDSGDEGDEEDDEMDRGAAPTAGPSGSH